MQKTDNSKSVLFVAFDDAGMKYLIEPKVKKRLEEVGWNVGECWYSDLNSELLRKTDVLVNIYESSAESMADTRSDNTRLSGHINQISDFIAKGGGVFAFVTEGRYTDDFEPKLNQLLKPMGASVWMRSFEEKNSQNKHPFKLQDPNYYFAFRTNKINTTHPITRSAKSMWFSHMVKVLETDKDWDVLVRAEDSASFAKSNDKSPALLAVRNWKKGRVAVLADHSSHTFNDGHHLFYDNGWILNNGDTFQVLLNTLSWLAESSVCGKHSSGINKFPPLSKKGGIIIKPETKFNNLKSFRGVFGIHTKFSGGINSVGQYAIEARKLKLDFIAVTDLIETEQHWVDLVKECEEASDKSLVVIPGVEWKDATGNLGYAVNIDTWPPMKRDLDFIHVMLQTAKGNGIFGFARPKDNPSRPWETGGMNALEVITVQNGQPVSMALNMWRALQPSPGMTLMPFVSSQVWTLDQLKQSSRSGFCFYLMAKSLEQLKRTPVPSFIPGYVSSGPVLIKFEAAPLVSDTWETYILWQTGDVISLQIEMKSANPFTKIELMSGDKAIRTFYPDVKSFKETVEIPMSHDGPFYLIAEDAAGAGLFSYVIPTRNMNFWNHVGSDRMNDYHNPVAPDPDGEIVYKGQRFSYGGLVTLAFGWGNYLRFYHPAPSSRYHPQGYETGQINSGLETLTTFPFIHLKGGEKDNIISESGVYRPYRRQLLATRDVAIIEERFPRLQFADGTGAKKYAELRTTESKTRLYLFRYHYEPYGQIILMGDSSVSTHTHVDVSVLKNKEPQLAVELLGLHFKGKGENLEKLVFLDQRGNLKTETVKFSDNSWTKKIKVSKGGYVTLTPDNYGLLGFHSIDGEMDVLVASSGHPSIIAGIDMDNGQKVFKGQEFKRRWIVTQDGGGENQNLFEDFSKLWGLGKIVSAPQYAPDKIISGKLLQEPYIVSIEVEYGGCIASFPSPAALPNRIIPITVKGIENNWSAGALRLDGTKISWYPGGVLEGALWIALEESGKYFLGHPLICDDPEIRVEILSIDDGSIFFNLHNSGGKIRHANLETAKVLKSRDKVIKYAIGPGKTVSGSVKLF